MYSFDSNTYNITIVGVVMPNSLSSEIGLRVRRRREELGLTREKMAELAGLSVQFMASVELGKQSMTTDSLVKPCRALGVSADYIVFGEKPVYARNDLNALAAGLSPLQRARAEKLLATFVEAVTEKYDR